MLVQPANPAVVVYLLENPGPRHDIRKVGELRRGVPGLVVDVVLAPTVMGVDRVLVLAEGALGWTTAYALQEVKE